MTRLYLETNFLMSCATGRDRISMSLLENCPNEIQRVIPRCCFMAALATLEDRQRQQNRLIETYRQEANEARRHSALPGSAELETHLRQVIFHALAAFDAFRERLLQAIEHCTTEASVQQIEPRAGRYLSGFSISPTLDPTDQLILTAILDDAQNHGDGRRAFLSENRRCFDDDERVNHSLRAAGIRYFGSAREFLHWHETLTET